MTDISPALDVLLLSGRFEVRGSCAYTLRLAEHLRLHEIQTRVVCSDARLIDQERRSRLSISEYSRLHMPGWRRLILQFLNRDLADNVPDLIHIQSRAVLVPGTWLARKLKRPFVLTVHDYLQPREKLRLDPIWGKRVIAVSESVRDALIDHCDIPPERVTVIRSGVEDVSEDGVRAPLDAGRVPVIGTAGPLEAVKGIPFFLGAAQKVLAVRQDVEFLISGAGPEERNLRRLARDLGISEHITFIPNMADFSTSLAAMDIFCLPSLRQGLGTIMLEAMALGTPVIATAVGGVYSVVRHGETGLIVPPSDSGRLAESILDLLNHPERARAIGAAAQRMVRQEFAVGKMVSATADLYREVVAQMRAEKT